MKQLLLLLLLVFPLCSQELPLRIITEDWAPYNYKENDTLTGFSVEVVQAIMRKIGVTYPIKLYPGGRGELLLDNEPNILSFSLFRTPEREKRYKWIGPISQESIYFYKRADDPRKFNSLEDIQKVNIISTPHDGLIFRTVKEAGITNISKITTRDGQFQHLFMGRADLMINVPPLGIAHYLDQIGKPSDALVSTGVKLVDFPLYIACSPEIPDSVIDEWQRALDAIKASGEFQKIYNKYLYIAQQDTASEQK